MHLLYLIDLHPMFVLNILDQPIYENKEPTKNEINFFFYFLLTAAVAVIVPVFFNDDFVVLLFFGDIGSLY